MSWKFSPHVATFGWLRHFWGRICPTILSDLSNTRSILSGVIWNWAIRQDGTTEMDLVSGMEVQPRVATFGWLRLFLLGQRKTPHRSEGLRPLELIAIVTTRPNSLVLQRMSRTDNH